MYPARKIVGIGLMTVGVLGLAPVVLMFAIALLGVADFTPAIFATTSLVMLGSARLILHRWPSRLMITLLSGIAAMISLGYYRFLTPTGTLASLDVHYEMDTDHFASDSIHSVAFWHEGSSGRLPGPKIAGGRMSVEKPYRNAEGQLEFQVKTSEDSSQPVRIAILRPPQEKLAFRVLNPESAHARWISYPQQEGLQSRP